MGPEKISSGPIDNWCIGLFWTQHYLNDELLITHNFPYLSFSQQPI
jgi:hypothetical protein